VFKPTAEDMLGSSARRAQRRINTALDADWWSASLTCALRIVIAIWPHWCVRQRWSNVAIPAIAARARGRMSASLRSSVHSSLRRADRRSCVDAFLQSVHLRGVAQACSQVVAMLVAIASNYVFKPTAEGLSRRSNLAAGGGLTRR
jgi:hypothetical protein